MKVDRIVLKRVRAAAGGARLLLTLEIGEGESIRTETLTVLSARLEKIPQVSELDGGTYAALVHEAAVCEAIERGLRMLGAAGTSRMALVVKLTRRGTDADVAQEAVTELCRRGYLDEVRGAESEVRKDIAKHWGNKRILLDLRAKGYGGDAIREAERLLEGESEEARLAALLRRRPVPTDECARAKLIASLVRYGYSAESVERLLDTE